MMHCIYNSGIWLHYLIFQASEPIGGTLRSQPILALAQTPYQRQYTFDLEEKSGNQLL